MGSAARHDAVFRAHRVLDEHEGREHRVRREHFGRSQTLLGKALSAQGALLDRVALDVMERAFMSSGRPSLGGNVRERIEAAAAVYSDPTLFEQPSRYFRPTGMPREMRVRRLSRLRSGERLRLTFESTYEVFEPGFADRYASYDRNAINKVHFWRHHRRGAPTVICIHSWCGGLLPFEERVFGASTLYRAGLNVALFTMPFHGGRTPSTASFPGQLFPSRDLQRSNEAWGQAVADLRVLMAWLRDEHGVGPIGVTGISLGGYTTALLASIEPSLAFAVPIVAPASFADILWHHGAGRAGRAEAERSGVTVDDMRRLWAVHSPLMRPLAIAKERTLIVWGEGDRVVPSVHQLALWEHWNRPAIRAFSGGHILQFGRLWYIRAIRKWLDRHIL